MSKQLSLITAVYFSLVCDLNMLEKPNAQKTGVFLPFTMYRVMLDPKYHRLFEKLPLANFSLRKISNCNRIKWTVSFFI